MSSMRRSIRLPSPAMVVASIALVVAVGGTGYAAISLPAGSVGATQIRKGAVERAKIKAGAVDETKLAHDSLTGLSIRESSLGKVPFAGAAESANNAANAANATNATNATNAANATNAVHATAAAALDMVIYRTATATAPPSSGNLATVTCGTGQHAVGGGAKVDDVLNAWIIDAYPDPGGTSWTARAANAGTLPVAFTVYVACITAAAAG